MATVYKFGGDPTGAFSFGIDEITGVAPVFAGVIPAQVIEVGVPTSLNISSYWINIPTSFTLASGTLPPGLSLSSAGVISGTPTTEQTASGVSVTATNSLGSDTSNIWTFEVTPDVTVPTLKATPTYSGITYEEAIIRFISTESGFYRIVVMETGSTAPIVSEVLLGTGSGGATPAYVSGLNAVVIGANTSETVTGLLPEITYDVYLALVDGASNSVAYQVDSFTTTSLLNGMYASLSQANDYMVTRLYINDWNTASDNNKIRALRMATRELDGLSWQGYMTDSTQELSWPRYYVYNQEGYELDTETIPNFLMYATVELALSLLKADRWEEKDSTGMSQVTAGPVTVKFDRHDSKPRNHPSVMNYIRDYLAVGTSGANWTLLTRA